MTETNETAKIVDFSFRMKDYDDPSLTLDDALRQIRFHAIRVLNKHAAGEVELTPNLKKSLKWYNKYCNMADLEKLKLPF